MFLAGTAFCALTRLTHLSIHLMADEAHQLDLAGNLRLRHLHLHACGGMVQLAPPGVLETLTALTALHLKGAAMGQVVRAARFPIQLGEMPAGALRAGGMARGAQLPHSADTPPAGVLPT